MTLPRLGFPPPLTVSFYERDAVRVARELLGKLLVRQSPGGRTLGRIVEVEAYLAYGDPACHAARGRTPRNASMFGPPGRAYVYAIHSRWCFNVVVEPWQVGSAVLIRAVEPLVGVPLMQRRRGRDKLTELTRGPARLCEAFDIDRRLDGWRLGTGRRLWVAADHLPPLAPPEIGCSPRIGITLASDLPLRFYVRGNPHVSGPKRWRV